MPESDARSVLTTVTHSGSGLLTIVTHSGLGLLTVVTHSGLSLLTIVTHSGLGLLTIVTRPTVSVSGASGALQSKGNNYTYSVSGAGMLNNRL